MQCTIVSNEASIFSGDIKMLSVSGSEGELGIHPGHTPLLTAIKPGSVVVTDAQDNEQVFYIAGGFIEVQPQKVTLLADTVLRTDEIDQEAVIAAQQNAQQKLKSNVDKESAALIAQLAELSAQLRTLKLVRKH